MSKATLERQIEQRLFESEVRFTKGRRAVIEALAGADGPKSAAELSAVLGPEVPLSSIYRTLSILEEAGIVVHHLGAKGLTRFEFAEWLTGHHHHLVCLRCGAVTDVDIPSTKEESVRALVAEIAKLGSFHATDHSLEIEGLCSRCA